MNQPPQIAKWLLKKVMLEYDEVALNDLDEEFDLLVAENNLQFARVWYCLQVMKSIPANFKHIIYWSFAMLRNYIIVALRNIKKQKIYSLINISGLALGLAVFTLFSILVELDTNADKFHENADRIFSVIQVLPSDNKDEEHIGFTPNPFLQALLNEIPEIENATQAFLPGNMIVRYEDNIFHENRIMFVDQNFLSVFTFETVIGDPTTILNEPYSIVLTEKMAQKYFVVKIL